MNKVLKSSLGVAAAAAVIGANVVSSTMLVSAYGDNSATGARQKYTIEDINGGALGKWDGKNQKVVLNSIMDDAEAKKSGKTGNTLGSELNFVAARQYNNDNNGVKNVLNGNSIKAEDGKYYIISMYVHNNNPNGYQAVAEGVKGYFTVPGDTAKKVTVGGVITMNSKGSSNSGANVTADITKYWDTVDFTADHKFHLEYVSGSGLLEANKVDAKGNITGGVSAKLSDAIVKDGVKFGQNLDGKLPGCFKFDNWVGIKVKVVYDQEASEVKEDTKFTVAKTVRKAGTKDKFAESIDAKVGDKVEYQIDFHNISKTSLKGVTIKDVLPKNAKLVAGTTKLYSSVYPNGQKFSDNIESGINIGDYAADAHGYIRFEAQIVDNSLVCGKNRLINWGLAGVSGKAVKDSADVLVEKTGGSCDNKPTPDDPTPDNPDPEDTTPDGGDTTGTTGTTTSTVSNLPSTGPAGVVTSILGAGSLVTTAGYYLASRKK